MNSYRWTKRIGLAGLAFLAVIAVFVTVVSILDVRVAGVYPEAFRLTAMMTAPFTLGLVAVVHADRCAGGDVPEAQAPPRRSMTTRGDSRQTHSEKVHVRKGLHLFHVAAIPRSGSPSPRSRQRWQAPYRRGAPSASSPHSSDNQPRATSVLQASAICSEKKDSRLWAFHVRTR